MKEIENGKTYHKLIHELRSPNENMTATVSTDVLLSAAKHLLFPGKKTDSSAEFILSRTKGLKMTLRGQ